MPYLSEETPDCQSVRRIGLLDALDEHWMKLPLEAMREVGPAVQTLGGLLSVTNGQTFASLDKIAGAARLPKGTLRKHLLPLHEHGWIVHQGRQQTPSGRTRRTATIKVTSRTRDAAKSSYGMLPWWACCRIRRVGRMKWCARAVLSLVMARLAGLKKAAEDENGPRTDADELVDRIESYGDDRFKFGLVALERQTGLSRPSVVEAKRRLAGIVNWLSDTDDCGGNLTDILAPNWSFRIVVTPAPQGGCWLDFERG